MKKIRSTADLTVDMAIRFRIIKRGLIAGGASESLYYMMDDPEQKNRTRDEWIGEVERDASFERDLLAQVVYIMSVDLAPSTKGTSV